MAEGILGLGSSGSASLNQELIDKLKAAERTAFVEPIETNIENITADIETFDVVDQAVKDVLEAIRPFDWFKTDGVNAFEEKAATTTGTSVIFDAADVTSLNEGTTTVEVTQIGQKDVFQSNSIDSSLVVDGNGDPVNSLDIGDLTINGTTFKTGTDPDTEDDVVYYTSFQDLAEAINKTDGLNASIEEVSTGSYRLIIKSDEIGTANELSFSGDASIALGLNSDVYTSSVTTTSKTDLAAPADIDGNNDGLPTNLTVDVDGVLTDIDIEGKTYQEVVDTLNALDGVNASFESDGAVPENFSIKVMNDNGSFINLSGDGATALGLTTSNRVENELNNTLKAQDMKMTVDGVSYEANSNEIVVDGLTIQATTEGVSTISIKNDTSFLATQMQSFVDAYNNLAEVVGDAAAVDSDMYNKSGLKSILDQVKQKVLGEFGPEGDQKSLFSIGLGFDADLSGKLTFDESVFNQAVSDDLDSLKDMFIGSTYYTEDNPGGFGTQLKSLLDNMYFSDGAVDLFQSSLTKREETLIADLEKAEETLDTKYEQLAAQFAAYSTIITQMEASFGGLQMMIEQSTADN